MRKLYSIFSCLTAVVAGLQAADILVDDFSSGSVGIDGRIFLRDIYTGWYGPNGDPACGIDRKLLLGVMGTCLLKPVWNRPFHGA